jgi:hypothetical protein
MKISWSLLVGITGLVLIMSMGPSWGQVPPTNDTSLGTNTGGGTGALENNAGLNNTAYGRDALQNNKGFGNTAVGVSALVNTEGSFSIGDPRGSGNTAVGFAAIGNTARSNKPGFDNTAVGASALFFNDTGNNNTAVGVSALSNSDAGNNNTAVGSEALRRNFNSSDNTAVGFEALENQSAGDHNTAVGGRALQGSILFEGDDNTAVGFEALSRIDIGDNNIAVGHQAGSNLTTGSDNIYLSARGMANESDTIRIGRGQTSTFIAGITGLNVMPVSGSTVMIDNNFRLGVAPSSARYKQDIETMGIHSHGLLQLRPVTFRYKQDVQEERQYGLIAEEVAEVYPELVTRGHNGEVESVRYHALIPMLLNELQHQQGQLSALTAENERLRTMVVQQKERDEALAVRLERLEAAAASETLASR